MFKKLIPLVLMVFVSACATTDSSPNSNTPKQCCEKCEQCKSGDCSKCCKDGACKMCMKGKSAKGSGCPECDKADREWREKHGSMKH